jgi:hypothetical protein
MLYLPWWIRKVKGEICLSLLNEMKTEMIDKAWNIIRRPPFLLSLDLACIPPPSLSPCSQHSVFLLCVWQLAALLIFCTVHCKCKWGGGRGGANSSGAATKREHAFFLILSPLSVICKGYMCVLHGGIAVLGIFKKPQTKRTNIKCWSDRIKWSLISIKPKKIFEDPSSHSPFNLWG